MLNNYSLRNEIIAGITTFFTMAYIVIVNPMILSGAGMDYNAVFVATCVSAALGCFVMGLLANYPIALAPSMSLNAYFSFYVIHELHVPWQIALGMVFLAGLLFAFLTFTRFRQWLIYAMPHSLQLAISAGIGVFLIAIALKGLKISPADHFANLLSLKAGLCLVGVLLTLILARFRVIGAILLSMLIVTGLGALYGLVHVSQLTAMPPSIEPTLFKLALPHFTQLQDLVVVLVFLFVALFDNTGTLIAVLHQAKLLPKNQHDTEAKRLNKALFADSVAAMAGAVAGTSSTGSYIESAAGVSSGGRTGLTAIVVGVLFLAALFFAPLAKAIPDYATAVALIYVGILMASSIKTINWRDLTESVPALLCILTIPVTFSIADGVCAGFISHVVLKTLRGRYKQVSFALWSISGLCLLYLTIRP